MKNSKPDLRFDEFKLEWIGHSIGSLGTVVTGNTPPTSNSEYYGGDNLFVSPADINDERYVYKTKTTLTDQGFNKGRKIPPKSIMFVCIGSTIGKVALTSQNCVTNQQINAVKFNTKIIPEFAYSVLEKYSHKIKLLAGEQAVPIINKSEFSKICLLIPEDKKEQQKIASFLTSVDSKISQLTEKHRLLKEYKKGVMQQIFSQQLHFKDEDGKAFPEWESMSLDDVLLIQFDSLKMEDNESYELITVKRRFGGITSRGNYLGKDVLVKNQFTIHENEFVISKRQIVHGACGLVPKKLEGAIVSNEYNVFRPVADKLDLDYFNRFSTTPYMRRSYFINSDGVHIEKLLFKTQSWLKTKVDLPCLKEQQKISLFLQSIDNKIDAVEQQVEQTKQFKKGLLQQMFV